MRVLVLTAQRENTFKVLEDYGFTRITQVDGYDEYDTKFGAIVDVENLGELLTVMSMVHHSIILSELDTYEFERYDDFVADINPDIVVTIWDDFID